MSLNYATPLPNDRRGNSMQDLPSPVLALQVDASETAAASSVLALTDNTTSIEVAAVGAGAVIKWIPTSSTNPSVISAFSTANFDHAIPANTIRRFVVPIERQGTSSIVGLNKQAGLYQRVAVKSVGAASVLTTQY